MKKYLGFLLLVLSTGANAQSGIYGNVETLLKSGKAANALATLDSIGKIGSNSATSVFQCYKARCLSSLNRNDEALKICSDAIMRIGRKDTVLHQFYFIRSGIYMEIGKTDSAIQDNNMAIELKPTEISYYINASYFYGETGDYENAFAALEKAIKLDSKNIYILNNISYYSSMTKHYDMAIKFATEGLKYTNDSTWRGSLLNNRGFANLGLNKYEAALKDINEAIRYYPENPYAYYNKALVYIQQKEFSKACENLNLAKQYGALNMTRGLLKQYCEK